MTIRAQVFILAAIVTALLPSAPSRADSQFQTPWSNQNRAIVLDGYEHNSFNLPEIIKDPRVAAFIHKGSDGMPANYHCNRIADVKDQEICRRIWRNYAVSRELYQTRRALAKALGLKWGSYHLARPGNPIEQANHFIDYAEPTSDELMALDIEDNDPTRFMSLQDGQIFAEQIKLRTGRYPVLYTNGTTAKYIADHRLEFPILSRLPLWYARYETDIAPHFPKGNWQDYALWQFASQSNCTKMRCPYRPNGTNRDIDVNIADMTVTQLKQAWPFDNLIPAVVPDDMPRPGERPSLPDDILMASMEPPLVDYRQLLHAPRMLALAAERWLADAQDVLDHVDETPEAIDTLLTASIARSANKPQSGEKLTVEAIRTSLQLPIFTGGDHPDSHLITGLISFCFDNTKATIGHWPAYAMQH
ncbi:glycoside hydrolase family 25 protein [Phyllobacterium myrsinacearum]|uniref:GH25 family lysozyme M1 (1,4-beta-N-acetylmuramidase) n=1 Tax=Phyllobacterium myrsinacearum TaxID=28101 RepID=A0A839EEU0_9HYPH|nr:GH25 family lysozyme [Phyllobacterium myrsinacearum]MBA8876918.1 GH25 family lysozyme M1 (1,4-beta-N-acetylmuramidase) [Phyllobacterium myrsinacearum]